MSEFEVIVAPTDPESANTQLLAWLNDNSAIRLKLGENDLIRDEVLADCGQIKHQYRIRRSLVEPNST